MEYGYYLRRAASLFGDKMAVISHETGVGRTFAEVDERADALAAYLVTVGVEFGDRVADVQWNRPEVLDVDFGVSRSGGARMPLNARAGVHELIQTLSIGEPKVLILDTAFSAFAAELVAAVSSITHVIGSTEAGGIEFEDALARGRAALEDGLQLPKISDDAVLSLKFTGGSTGIPKGTVRTHAAQEAIALNMLLDLFSFQLDDVLLQIQPLSHGGGGMVLPCVMRGSTQITMARFDAAVVLDLAEKGAVTCIKLVPTMLLRMLDRVGDDERIGPNSLLRGIIYGAAPMPREPLEKAMRYFGPVMIQTYGQTEAPSTISALNAEQHRIAFEENSPRLASAGKPYTTVTVEIRDRDGNVVPQGERGEVVVKGPMVMSRYWKLDDPGIDEHGWVHTGDIGVFDDGGYLFLVDRINDMIISGGFNVYPKEVEDALYSYDGVQRAVVFGVEHDDWGESVITVIVPKDKSTFEPSALLDHVGTRLARYKLPKCVVVTDSLPETAAAKVTRRAVREALLSTLGGKFPHENSQFDWIHQGNSR